MTTSQDVVETPAVQPALAADVYLLYQRLSTWRAADARAVIRMEGTESPRLDRLEVLQAHMNALLKLAEELDLPGALNPSIRCDTCRHEVPVAEAHQNRHRWICSNCRSRLRQRDGM